MRKYIPVLVLGDICLTSSFSLGLTRSLSPSGAICKIRELNNNNIILIQAQRGRSPTLFLEIYLSRETYLRHIKASIGGQNSLYLGIPEISASAATSCREKRGNY